MAHLYVEGMNGQVEVDDEWIRINRKGVMGKVMRGVGGLLGRGIQIRLSDLEDIEISYPRLTQRGWIRFLTAGDVYGSIGIAEAAKDPSTVLFTKKDQDAFENLRQQVKGLISQRSNDGLVQAIAAGVAASSQKDLATQIRDLAALRDEGLLTEAEFEYKKQQLLREG